MSLFETLRHDARFSLSTLRHNPRLVLVTVPSVAFAIGAITVVFAVFEAVVLRAFPGSRGDRLVSIVHKVPSSSLAANLLASEDVEDLQRYRAILEAVAWHETPRSIAVALEGKQEIVTAVVSTNFFTVFGVRPTLGRWFDARDLGPGGAPVVILSHAFWRQRLGGDPGVLGSALYLGDRHYQVVGVMPANFRLPGTVDAWIPELGVDASGGPVVPHRRTRFVIGLVKSGLSLDGADKLLAALKPSSTAPDGSRLQFAATSLRDQLVGRVGRVVSLLMMAVVVMMTIASINVAMLFLASRVARAHECAVLAALGASPARLVRQSCLAALFLGLSGGALGALLAFPLLGVVRAWGVSTVPRLSEAVIDRTVLVVALAAALAISLITGLLELLRPRELDVMSAIRGMPRTWSNSGRLLRGLRTEGCLVVGQVALALVLVVSASLLLHSLVRLLTVDVGFSPKGLIGVEFSRVRRFDPAQAFTYQFLEEVSRLPGIRSVAATTTLRSPSAAAIAAVRSPTDWTAFPQAADLVVSDEFFSTMGTPVISGRTFDRGDTRAAPCTVIVNQLVARAWTGQDAVGQYVDTNVSLDGSRSQKPEPCRVVGVVGDTRARLGSEARPQIYFSYRYRPIKDPAFLIRLTDESESTLPAIVGTARAIDATRRVKWAGPMDELLRETIVSPRFYSFVFGSFGALALALTAMGIYGTMNQVVTRRRREVGIRLAVGAQPREIRFQMLQFALTLLGAGLGVGLFGALAAGRSLQSLLFEIGPGDPVALACALLVMLTVGFVAALAPARRASRIDPVELLRSE
jgi:predicted permease